MASFIYSIRFKIDEMITVSGFRLAPPPNGFHQESCSRNSTVRVWDLSRKRNVDILTAHEEFLSGVNFESNR